MDKKCTCHGEHKCTTNANLFGKKIQPLASPVTSKNKIGRNDKCPCNSGKKYKSCCLNKTLPLLEKLL